MMPRPRGGPDLTDSLNALRKQGVDTLVCLLADKESIALGLAEEGARFVALGGVFHHFPVPDFDIPRDRAGFLELAAGLAEELRGGRHVAVHCRGGIGRSGMLAASVLLRLDWTLPDALNHLAYHRGHPVPETDAQRDWLANLPVP